MNRKERRPIIYAAKYYCVKELQFFLLDSLASLFQDHLCSFLAKLTKDDLKGN